MTRFRFLITRTALFLAPAAITFAQTWTTQAPIPTPRSNLVTVSAKDATGRELIYAIGGVLSSSQGTLAVEAYDAVANTWTTMASAPTARARMAATRATNGRIYVFGGEIGNQATDIVEEYDPIANTWTAKASMPAKLFFLAAAGAPNGKVYVFGGANDNVPFQSDTVYEYNPTLDSWKTVSLLPSGQQRGLTATTGCNGLIYIVYQLSTVMDIYDPITNTWSVANDQLPFPVENHSATTGSNGRLYVFGATSQGVLSPTAWAFEYDPVNDLWNQLPAMPNGGRIGLGAARSGNRVYAISGYRKSGGTLEFTESYGDLAPSGACADCTAPPAGLVAWWPLDETSGNTSTELANGLNGTWMDAPAATGGVVGGALQFSGFSGAGPRVTVPNDPKLNFGSGDFTIDAWINPITSALTTIVSKLDNTSHQGYELYLDLVVGGGSGPLPVGLNLNTISLHFGGFCQVSVNKWTHIAVVLQRTTTTSEVRCYLNGVLADTKAVPAANLGNTSVLSIGNGVPGGVSAGKIDEVELFNRALSSDEINRIYAAGSSGKCKSSVNPPWDKPFCQQSNTIVTSVAVCNYSTAPKTYNLSFTGMPAGSPGPGIGCTIDGPSVFESVAPPGPIPPPIQITVPPNTCAPVPIRIHRPAQMNSKWQVGCYRADLQDIATGDIFTAQGSVQDRRDICVSPVFRGTFTQSSLTMLPSEVINFDFLLRGTTDTPMPVRYRIEAMPSDMAPGRSVISLNRLEPGAPVSGSVVLQNGQTASVPIRASYTGNDPLGYQDIILYTETATGDFVAAGSQNIRLVRPNEAIAVSAATLARGLSLAAGSIASVFGSNLATGSEAAQSTVLPTRLAGSSVNVTDAKGQKFTAPLFYASPSQINFQIPSGVSEGPAFFTIVNNNNTVATGSLNATTPTPGLFAANASGAGVAAAFYLRVLPDGSRQQELVFNPQTLAPVPINISAASGSVYLILFGTGITGGQQPVTAKVGGVDVPVLAALPQGQYVGLDQINIGPLPISLAGRGEVPVVISGGGLDSSTAATVVIGGASVSQTVNASFVTVPVPLSIRVAGNTVVGNSGLLTFNTGTAIPLDVPVNPQTLSNANTRYRFFGWSQGGPISQTIALTVSGAYAAYFLPEHRLTISGAATANPASPDGFYSENPAGGGAKVAITGTCPAGQSVSGYNVQDTGNSTVNFVPGATATATITAPKTVTVVCGAPKPTACITPPSGLIGWYPLDETTGPSLDFAPAGARSNGNWIGTPQSVAGIVGTALSFTAGRYVEAASAAEADIATGDFTVDAWIQANPVSNVITFIDKRELSSTVASRGYAFYLFNGNLGFQLGDNATNSATCSGNPANSACTNWVSSAQVADGKWHLVTATISRSSKTGGNLYVDGKVVLTFDPTIRALSLSNAGKLRIGAGNGSIFPGKVDEVEVFNRVLTPVEIQLLFDVGSLGKCKSPPATVTLTVTSNPVGLGVRIGANGAFSAGPISQPVPANQTQTIATQTPQVLSGTGYSFAGWSTGGSTPLTTVQPASNFTATSNFQVSCHLLTVNSSGGTVALNPPSGVPGFPANCYAPGTVVTLTAAPNAGNTLTGWSGDATGTTSPTTVTINAPKTVTASFGAPTNITLTVATNPTGLQARVGTTGAYAPAPIVVQQPPSDGSNNNTFISVTNPQMLNGTGYTFTNWSTGGSTPTTTIGPVTNFLATANFTVACYVLTVNLSPANGGTVTKNPATGVAGFTNCYAPGSSVIVTATPGAGFVLSGFSGATSASNNTATVVMSGPTTLGVNFGTPSNVTLTVNTSPAGLDARIGTSGAYAAAPLSSTVLANTLVTVSVTDPLVRNGAGYRFTNWTGATPTSSATATVPVGAGNTAATANFTIACYVVTSVVTGPGQNILNPAAGNVPGFPANCYAPGTSLLINMSPGNEAGVAAGTIQTASGTQNANGFTTISVTSPVTITTKFALKPNPVISVTPAQLVSGTTYTSNVSFQNQFANAGSNLRITAVTFTNPASVSVTTPMSSLVYGAFPATGSAGPLPIQYTIPASIPSGTNLYVAFTVSVQNAAGDTFLSGPTWQLTKP